MQTKTQTDDLHWQKAWATAESLFALNFFCQKSVFGVAYYLLINFINWKPRNLRSRERRTFNRTNLPTCQKTWISCLRQQQKSHKFVFCNRTKQQIIGQLCFSLDFIYEGKLHYFPKYAGFRVRRFSSSFGPFSWDINKYPFVRWIRLRFAMHAFGFSSEFSIF